MGFKAEMLETPFLVGISRGLCGLMEILFSHIFPHFSRNDLPNVLPSFTKSGKW
jgi:hypothetical protein